MKKVFCIISLVLGALSFVAGSVYLLMVIFDLIKKILDEKNNALDKLKSYVASKMQIIDVQAQDVVVKSKDS